MLKETITYIDFNGVERTEDFYFNFTKAELAEMELMQEGGMQEYLQKIIAAKDQQTLVGVFKELVLAAYGEKSEDGRKFIKNAQIREEFECTEAYSELFMRFATDEQAAIAFFKGVVPADLSKKIEDEKIQNSRQSIMPSR